jgi:hypothetical protein
MKLSILGTGDIGKIPRYTDISKQKLERLLYNIAYLIVKKGHEIVIIPDKGIPYKIAKLYKKLEGKKIYGLVPIKDETYKNNTSKYMNIIDSKINFNTWRDVSSEIIGAGEICIILGMSCGIMREVSAFKYKIKYHNSKTKILWFKNTLSSPIHPEIQEEIPITYIKNVKELEKYL